MRRAPEVIAHLSSLWRPDQTQFDCGQLGEDGRRCLDLVAAMLPETLKRHARWRRGADTEITRSGFFDPGPRFATSYRRTIAGTAAQVADHLEEVFEATGSHGFMLGHVVSMPHDLSAIVEMLDLNCSGVAGSAVNTTGRGCATICSTTVKARVMLRFGELFGTLAH